MPYLPPGLEQWTALGLIALSFVSSLITATFSLGGGSLMIIAMTLVMPPAVVVPVHGCVQLGSNVGRAISLRDHIQWNFILWVTLGASVGSVVGGKFAHVIPERGVATLIGIFVLVTTWLPQPKFINGSRVAQFAGGALVSALGMVVGAAGPLVAAFVRGMADRRRLVGTHATLNALQHLFKVLVFVTMGFAFRQYLPLIGFMVMAGLAGTAAGSRLLTRLPETVFRLAFKVLLSLAAVGLIWRAAL
jgi:uncharacterized membrane protein YfcA